MADTLPSINFGFEDLRQRMASFSDRFDAFIAEGRKRVLEERNQFRINVAELQGTSPIELLVLYSTPIPTSISMLTPYRGSASPKKRPRYSRPEVIGTCPILD